MDPSTQTDVDLLSIDHFLHVSDPLGHGFGDSIEFAPEVLSSWTNWFDQINAPTPEPVKSTIDFPVFEDALELGEFCSLLNIEQQETEPITERTHIPLPKTLFPSESNTHITHIPLPEAEMTLTDLPLPLFESDGPAATFTVDFDKFYFVDSFSNPHVSHYLAQRAIANRLGPYEFTLCDRGSNAVLNVFCPSELVTLWCNRESSSGRLTAKEVMPVLNAICKHYGVPCVELDESVETVARAKQVNRDNLEDDKNHQVVLGERCLDCENCHHNRTLPTNSYAKFLTQKFYAHFITDNAKSFVDGRLGDVPAFHLYPPPPPRYRSGRPAIHYNGQAIEFLPLTNLRPLLNALFAYLQQHAPAFQTLTLANASQWANAVFGIAQHLSKLKQKRGTPPLEKNLDK